jgi:hypothetical protein
MTTAARPLRADERALVSYLWSFEASEREVPPEMLVTEMDDGGMGSLSFVSARPNRSLGKNLGVCSFPDTDGVLVEAALLLDREGDLFQLDLWKVNFAPLIRIPDPILFSTVRKSPNGS